MVKKYVHLHIINRNYPSISIFHSDGGTHLWMTPCSLAIMLLFQSCKSTRGCTLTATQRVTQRSRRPRWIQWRASFESQGIVRVCNGNECALLCTWEDWKDTGWLRHTMNEWVYLKYGNICYILTIMWGPSFIQLKSCKQCRIKSPFNVFMQTGGIVIESINKALYKQGLCWRKMTLI